MDSKAILGLQNMLLHVCHKSSGSPSPVLWRTWSAEHCSARASKISESCRAMLGAPGSALRRIVIQPRPEPALHFGNGVAFALGQIFNLVLAEFAHGEVFGVRVGEIKAADARPGPHGKTFREFDTGMLLSVEQVPKNRLLRVIGTGRIASRRADAAIFFGD